MIVLEPIINPVDDIVEDAMADEAMVEDIIDDNILDNIFSLFPACLRFLFLLFLKEKTKTFLLYAFFYLGRKQLLSLNRENYLINIGLRTKSEKLIIPCKKDTKTRFFV
jgi:hypothetical protein